MWEFLPRPSGHRAQMAAAGSPHREPLRTTLKCSDDGIGATVVTEVHRAGNALVVGYGNKVKSCTTFPPLRSMSAVCVAKSVAEASRV